MKFFSKVVLVFLFFWAQHSFAQQRKIDSLENILKNTKQDTLRLRLYLALGDACEVKDNLKYAEPAIQLTDKLLSQAVTNEARKNILKQKALVNSLFAAFYDDANDTAQSLKYIQKNLSIYNEIKDTLKIINSVGQLSNYYISIGNIPKALEYCQKGLSISQEMKYKRGIATCLDQMAVMYWSQGNFDQAFENYQKSIQIYFELKDTNRAGIDIILTGNIYSAKHNVKKSLEYYNKAMSLFERMKVTERVRMIYNRIGIMYMVNKDLKNSLINFKKSLSMAEIMNDEDGIAATLNLIGKIHFRQGNIDSAAECYNKSLSLAEKIHDPYTTADVYSGLARIYLEQKNYRMAKDFNERSMKLHSKYWDIVSIPEGELLAAQIDSASGNGIGAYVHYKQYIKLRDQLKSEEVRKAATQEKFQSEYDKQKAIDKAEQDKKDITVKEEAHRQKIVRNSFIGGFALMLVLAIVVFRSYRLKQKANEIIAAQKQEVEEQKHLIEEKQKELLDSIRYAKRIQTALITPEKYIDKSIERLTDKK